MVSMLVDLPAPSRPSIVINRPLAISDRFIEDCFDNPVSFLIFGSGLQQRYVAQDSRRNSWCHLLWLQNIEFRLDPGATQHEWMPIQAC